MNGEEKDNSKPPPFVVKPLKSSNFRCIKAAKVQLIERIIAASTGQFRSVADETTEAFLQFFQL